MSTIESTAAELDADLARRLERLTSSRMTRPAPVPGPELDSALSARVQKLAERTSALPGRSDVPRGRRRRRHAAKKSRIAALVLSLATTGGLTAGFAAIDGPSGSTITAAGGVVSTEGVADTIVNGDVYTNKWGPVQVQVAFAPDGSLTSVDAVQVPFRDNKSVRINDRAVPVLNSEALTAQSAEVDSVSGATYTSVDYERSLQSAIDAARAAGITQLA